MASDPDAPLFDALWTVIAAEGWSGVTAGRLAAASGMPAAELLDRFRSRLDLIGFGSDYVDRQVEAGTVPDPAATPRDRIFDLLMRRLDVMQPHRAGIVPLMALARRDPAVGAALLPALRRSAARMLDAADLESGGPAGALRVIGLAGVWLQTMRAWEQDETQDLGPTMAALDRALDRAEQFGRSIGLRPGDRSPPPEADPVT